jgi:hypothetical protein
VPTAQELIERLNLEPLPIEGGFFRQTYVSAETIPPSALPERYRGDKPFSTAIYYLLTSDADSFSAMHRLPTDEVYHFYLGDPVEMLLLFPDGSGRRVVLGQDIAAGQHVQFLAPAGAWQGSRLIAGGHFALMGTTMAPGFDPTDFVSGRRAELVARYPNHANVIRALTHP